MICESQAILRPPLLKEGATIGVVAPAKSFDSMLLDSCLQQLEQRGFQTRVAPNVTTRVGYFAGDDAIRAQAFMECWCDSSVDAVWCITGGYGCMPLLNQLDYTLLRAHPKIFIGMSDITALHAAIGKYSGLVTFLGPNLGYIFKENSLPFSETHVWKSVVDEHNEFSSFSGVQTLCSGVGEGRLVGGNLALICALMGTPWQLETKEKILVLEDVNEPPYRIDRMLCQLKLGGVLQELAGAVLCTWHGCETDTPEKSFALSDVLEKYFSNAPYPVINGFPSGHVKNQVTLPLNCLARLDSDQKSIEILGE